MKAKRLTVLATLMAVVVLFMGCKKEENNIACSEQELGVNKSNNYPPIVFGIDIDLPTNTQKISDLLMKKEDPDGEKINYQL